MAHTSAENLLYLRLLVRSPLGPWDASLVEELAGMQTMTVFVKSISERGLPTIFAAHLTSGRAFSRSAAFKQA